MAELTDIRETVREKYAAAAPPRGGLRRRRRAPAAARRRMTTGAFGAAALRRRGRRGRTGEPRSTPRSDAASRPRSPICTQGEIVLDLGSGAGADVLISARRVGTDAAGRSAST